VTRLIDDAARRVGSQSIVAILDVREHGAPGGYRHFTEKGTKPTDMGPQEFARRMEAEGAGEILVNAIDRDGLMRGYDFTLVDQVRSATALPLTVVGGAGSLSDIAALIARFGVIGAAAGSLFVFKGPYRAVLINYPNPREKEALLCHTAVTTQSAL
jgi:cyclase